MGPILFRFDEKQERVADEWASTTPLPLHHWKRQELTGIMKTITVYDARFLLSEGWTYDLNAFDSIEDDAALALKTYEGELLLNGLTSLTLKAAKALSEHRGGYLALNGLSNLADDVIEALSQHRGDLYLNGISELSNAAAKHLAKHNGQLWLQGLRSLSAASAKALSKHRGQLHLDGLANLSPDVAQGLALHNGDLHLRGVEDIPADAAKELKKHKGSLFLHGVTSLSPEAATNLAGEREMLDLQGITHLTPEVAAALSKTEGYLNLRGVSELVEEVAKELSAHCGEINLRGIASVPVKIALLFRSKVGKINGMQPMRWIVEVCPTVTRDPMFAATLMAFEITKADSFTMMVADDNEPEYRIWIFEPKTPDEQDMAEKIARAWKTGLWKPSDKQAPFYVRRSFDCYKQLMSAKTPPPIARLPETYETPNRSPDDLDLIS